MKSKDAMKHGVFKNSYYYDNGSMIDENGKMLTKRQLKEKQLQKQSQINDNMSYQSTRAQSMGDTASQARLRNTNQKFENSQNKYGMFLNDKTELPRLSILENYN